MHGVCVVGQCLEQPAGRQWNRTDWLVVVVKSSVQSAFAAKLKNWDYRVKNGLVYFIIGAWYLLELRLMKQ